MSTLNSYVLSGGDVVLWAEALAARLAGADEAESQAILLDVLRHHAAAVLGHTAAEDLDVDCSLLELGFSSFTALELSNRLLEATGLRIQPVAVFDHPTLALLAAHVRGELDTLAAAEAGEAHAPPDRRDHAVATASR